MYELLRRITLEHRGPGLRYGAALLCFVAALGIRFISDPWFPPGFPFVAFFPAVIVATFVAGTGPGIMCGVLCGLASWYFFIEPTYTFVMDRRIATAMVFYTVVVAVDISLIDGLLRRERQLIASEAARSAMTNFQGLLFQELQHRVANNLASVASMLRLERKRIAQNPSLALSVIDRADERIALMGQVHRLLYDPQAHARPLGEQIAATAALTLDMLDGGLTALEVVIAPDAAHAHCALDRALSLALLVTELVTNSLKHAFAPNQQGIVRVTLRRIDATTLEVEVADNGRGMPEPGADAHHSTAGLGQAIITGLVRQLGGVLSAPIGAGASTRVCFSESN